MEDRVPHVIALEDRERFPGWKASESLRVVDEVLGDVVAVRVDEWHPVHGRAQHVLRSEERKLPRINRQFENGSAGKTREDAVRRLGARDPPERQRNAQFSGRRDHQHDRGERGLGQSSEHR